MGAEVVPGVLARHAAVLRSVPVPGVVPLHMYVRSAWSNLRRGHPTVEVDVCMSRQARGRP